MIILPLNLQTITITGCCLSEGRGTQTVAVLQAYNEGLGAKPQVERYLSLDVNGPAKYSQLFCRLINNINYNG